MSLRIAIGIATIGRRDVLSEAVAELAFQTRPADTIVVCGASPGDVDQAQLETLGLPLRVIFSEPGSAHQRNAIFDNLVGFDAVLFIDDDFLMRKDYVEHLERVLENHPDVTVVTGHVLADGAHSAGVPLGEARSILARSTAATDSRLEEAYSGYGCNMAVRLAPLVTHGIRFNERLPLYAWLEDLDLSRRLARHGRIVKSRALQGVHMAVKTGRTSGRRYGYSQIANPIDLYRDGVIPLSVVLSHIGKPVASNLIRSLAPEPYIDRRGRLFGNLKAGWDLLRGRLKPDAILRM